MWGTSRRLAACSKQSAASPGRNERLSPGAGPRPSRGGTGGTATRLLSPCTLHPLRPLATTRAPLARPVQVLRLIWTGPNPLHGPRPCHTRSSTNGEPCNQVAGVWTTPSGPCHPPDDETFLPLSLHVRRLGVQDSPVARPTCWPCGSTRGTRRRRGGAFRRTQGRLPIPHCFRARSATHKAAPVTTCLPLARPGQDPEKSPDPFSASFSASNSCGKSQSGPSERICLGCVLTPRCTN